MNKRQQSILLAAMLVTFVTGSIHCFSVFLVPLENLLELPRAQISLFYSFALIFLTVSVLFGYLVYEKVEPATMILLSCTVAGAGLGISAHGTTWWSIFFGYSLIFGIANGFAYGYVLQLVGRALPDHKGFAMAAVTAAYAVGSVVFSLILARLVEHTSHATALTVMGVIIVISGIIAAVLMKSCAVSFKSVNQNVRSETRLKSTPVLVALLWLAYSCSVFAGLMAIGHAAGIVQSLGGEYGLAIWGAVFIGIGSSIGGFFIGWVINRNNMNTWLMALPIISAVFLFLLIFVAQPTIAIIVLSFIGFSYGAVIAVYPYAISEFFGSELGPKVYGRVFTAWGFAGLAGPWSAGKLFDQSGSYSTALIVAGMIALISTTVYYITQKTISQRSKVAG